MSFDWEKLRVAKAVFLAACACACAYGQATSGNIIGTVTDPAGAIVPNVSITITSQERGTVYNATSNESGNYSVVHILPGLYTMEFKASGFQRLVQKDVSVGLDRSTRMDVQLVVGQVTEEVSVTAAGPPLVTDRAEVSAALSSQQVLDLPTLNRNFTSLQLLMPGAQKMSWQHATSENPQQGIQINTNGQRFGSNNFMIDGADNNDPVLGIIVVNPAVDSVSEFKYTTGNYDAEYAQAGVRCCRSKRRPARTAFTAACSNFYRTTSRMRETRSASRTAHPRCAGTSSAVLWEGRL